MPRSTIKTKAKTTAKSTKAKTAAAKKEPVISNKTITKFKDNLGIEGLAPSFNNVTSSGSWRSVVLGIFIFCLVGALGYVSYAYYQEKNRDLTEDDVKLMKEQEVEALLGDLGKHILLPNHENPTIATIVDLEALKKVAQRDGYLDFYENAKIGYKLIIYSKRVILYDPGEDIIINTSPIQLKKDQEGIKTEETGSTAPLESTTSSPNPATTDESSGQALEDAVGNVNEAVNQ